MNQVIKDNKYVELNYRIVDQKTGDVLITIDFPLGFVHGANTVLDSRVMAELTGKQPGDTLSVLIDCTDLYGARDESLVVTDIIDNVPEDYRELGTRILMENEKGETKSFLVTRVDDKTLTIDGNHPLCGRQVIFELEVLTVRDATEEEIMAGGSLEQGPVLGGLQTRPI